MPGVPPNTGNLIKRLLKSAFKRGKDDEAEDRSSASQRPNPSQTSLDSSTAAQSAVPERMGASRNSRIPEKPPQLGSPVEGAAFGVDIEKPSGSFHNTATSPGTAEKPLALNPNEHEFRRNDISPMVNPDYGNSAPLPMLGIPGSTKASSDMEMRDAGMQSREGRPVEGVATTEPGQTGARYNTLAAQRMDPNPASLEPAAEIEGAAMHGATDTDHVKTPFDRAIDNGATLTREAPTDELLPGVSTRSDDTSQTTPANTAGSVAEKELGRGGEKAHKEHLSAAPEMSATSGPLEDFPETGEQHGGS